jgi:subtilisin-like proprotein convertase family protein
MLKRRLSRTVLVGCALWGAAACEGTTEEPLPARESEESETFDKADQWNARNDPGRFEVVLEYKLSALPTAGRSEHIPWPDTYWPTYADGTNARWDGNELSPVEKYDRAFNGWQPAAGFYDLKPWSTSRCTNKTWSPEYYDKLGPAATYVSSFKGNKETRDGQDSDADGKTDECGDSGEFDGVETWWGLCHAWVPAAILEKEPQKPVTRNGVRFEVSDIKALLIGQHDQSKAFSIGGRCNDKDVERDPKTGRIKNQLCRDTNAGTHHVVLANMLGKLKRAIAEDRTLDYEVWNQPIIEWKVDQLQKVTLPQALELLGVDPATTTTYPFNDKAVEWHHVKATTYYITESDASKVPYTDTIGAYTRADHYEYILELDKDGKVNGGEWIGDSNYNHSDFLWLPVQAQGGNPHVDIAVVRDLLAESRKTAVSGNSVTKEYPTTPGVAIPDNSATGVSSTVNVPDAGNLEKVEVTVDITHSYRGDVRIQLAKGGQTVMLVDQQGGGTADIKETFSAAAFVGTDAKGDWTLTVSDHYASDTGTLKGWTLKLTTAQATAPTIVTGEKKPAVAIPDKKAAGVTSDIEITQDLDIESVIVTTDITHPHRGDLQVFLTFNAKKVTLHDKVGGSADDLKQSFTVTGYEGMKSKGTWQLKVADRRKGDKGNFNGWKIEIKGKGQGPTNPEQPGTLSKTATPAAAIPDNTPAGASSTIKVTEAKTVKGVKVTVKITHSYAGALKLHLERGGITVVLSNLEGADATSIERTFDVAEFNTTSSAGDWKLVAIDTDAYGDTGTIDSWTLDIAY